MRLAIFAFIGLVIADGSVVVDTLTSIQGQTKKLDEAILAYNGGSAQGILDGSKALLKTTADGTAAINALQPLSVTEASRIPGVVQKETDDVSKAVNDLVSKKDLASKNSLGGVTYQQLEKQYEGAKAMSEAITTKVPESLKKAAKELSEKILNAVKKGVDAYESIKDQPTPAGLDDKSAAGGAAAGGMAGMAGMSNSTTAGSNSTTKTNTSTTPSGSAAPAGNSTSNALTHVAPLAALVAAMAIAL